MILDFSPSEMCASGTPWFHLVTVLYMVSAVVKIEPLLLTKEIVLVCAFGARGRPCTGEQI